MIFTAESRLFLLGYDKCHLIETFASEGDDWTGLCRTLVSAALSPVRIRFDPSLFWRQVAFKRLEGGSC